MKWLHTGREKYFTNWMENRSIPAFDLWAPILAFFETFDLLYCCLVPVQYSGSRKGNFISSPRPSRRVSPLVWSLQWATSFFCFNYKVLCLCYKCDRSAKIKIPNEVINCFCLHSLSTYTHDELNFCKSSKQCNAMPKQLPKVEVQWDLIYLSICIGISIFTFPRVQIQVGFFLRQ